DRRCQKRGTDPLHVSHECDAGAQRGRRTDGLREEEKDLRPTDGKRQGIPPAVQLRQGAERGKHGTQYPRPPERHHRSSSLTFAYGKPFENEALWADIRGASLG